MPSPAQHYDHAPITEAILDLRVLPRAGVSLDDLKKLSSETAEEFACEERTFEAMGLLHVQPGVSASASARQKQTGYKFTSSDKKYVFQRRFDGFNFSRLAPY